MSVEVWREGWARPVPRRRVPRWVWSWSFLVLVLVVAYATEPTWVH